MPSTSAHKPWGVIAVATLAGLLSSHGAGAASNSVRILTYNTHLLSPMMACGGPLPQCSMSPIDEYTRHAAERIANVLHGGYFDVVALNEVWDEDDGKDYLAGALGDVYTHYVKYADVFGGGFEEDSGLMLFSKFPFEPLPSIILACQDSQSSYGTDSNRIAYVKFDACEEDWKDCLAAKGAILVRLKHPSSGRVINVVATHLQADYDDSDYGTIRNRQLRQILGEACPEASPSFPSLVQTTLRPSLSTGETLCSWTNSQWLLLMGDLNIRGQGAVGQALHPAQAPNPAPQEWWSKIGNTAAQAPTTGYPLYDPWAETSSETDTGLTNGGERLDYVLAARRTRQSAAGAPPDLCVQHVWNPPEFEGLSDHRPLAADLNLAAAQCNPRLAYVMKPEEMGSVGLEQGKVAKKLGGQLKYAGGMQWWRLDEPGTYTIALSPQAVAQGVTFEAYEADNLSRPLNGAYQLGNDNMKVCDLYFPATGTFGRCESVQGQQMVLPKAPFYLRVFNPNRAWSGQYWIAIHRHSCRLRSDSCHLLPNVPTGFDFPAAGTLLNEGDVAWFSLDVQHQADSGQPQTLRFYAENAVLGDWLAPVLALRDESGLHVVSEIDGQPLLGPTISPAPSGAQSIARQGQTRTNAKYYLTVRRLDVNQTLKLRMGWQTNLLLLGGSNVGPFGAKLVCNDETNPEGGVDEIRLEVNIDNTGWQTRGESDFDCNDSADLRNWDAELGLIRYLDSVQVRLIEVDENAPNDESPIWPLGSWGLEADALAIGAPQAAAHGFEFEGGEYTFYVNMGKWLTQ